MNIAYKTKQTSSLKLLVVGYIKEPLAFRGIECKKSFVGKQKKKKKSVSGGIRTHALIRGPEASTHIVSKI